MNTRTRLGGWLGSLAGFLLLAEVAGAADRYWVGAAGANWSVASSWAATSGGAGGEGAPGSDDTAIFDGAVVNSAIIDAAYGGTVGAVDIRSGYTGTNTQNRNLTVSNAGSGSGNFSIAEGAAWRYTAGTAAELTVQGNMTVHGTVQCQRTSTTGNGTGRTLTVGGNLVVGSTGVFDADGQGFNAATGPGYGGSGAAGHGGQGGNRGPTAAVGQTYGAVTNPVALGSGGQNGPGGGAIVLVVSGATTHDGVLTSGGAPVAPTAAFWGPGSGGSINLTTASLSGSGELRANAAPRWYDDPAGGGRIAIVLTGIGMDFSSFTGSVTAFGTTNHWTSSAGTIYKKTAAQTHGDVVVHNRNIAQGILSAALPAGVYQFDAINVYSNGNLSISNGVTLTIPTAASVLTNGNGGTGYLTLADGTLTTPNGLTIPDGVALNSSTTNQISLTGPITVASGGSMTHYANGSTEAYKLNLAISGNLTVDSGGAINVSGKGYAATKGPGYGGSSGAGHGGWGGTRYSGAAIGPTYGSATNPVALGSGGQDQPGGGAVLLTVTGSSTINGVISANGAGASLAWGPGSGGSINLNAASISGAGTVHAIGGNVGYQSPAGGGRIAISLTGGGDFSTFSGSIGAYGTTNNGSYGSAAGTVYKKTAAQTYGDLIVDNFNCTVPSVQTIAANVINETVGDVIIRNKGHLRIETNQTLSVYGSWSNAATFSATSGATVVFAGIGTPTNTIYGTNVFTGLRCQTPGMTLKFQAGGSNAVTESIVWTGAAGSNLFLRSTVSGTQWKLNVMASASTKTFQYLDVQDSDARPSAAAISPLDSKDSGNNTNWSFAVVGQTNVWNGDTSELWTDGGNWSLARAPETFDARIVIPSGCPNYPHLTGPVTINELDLQAGSLRLSNQVLTVEGAVTIAGALIAVGSETITFNSNVAFSAGTFTPAQSTVKLNGAGPQNFTPGGNTFYALNITQTNAITVTGSFTTRDLTFPSSSANVAFGGGFTATDLRLVVSDGATLTFGAGQTYTVNNQLLLSGASGNPVVLTSSGTWRLNANGYTAARFVDVTGSDAAGGRTIYAVNSTDGGNNQNWDFGAGKLWAGTNTAWMVDGNWLPSGAPVSTNVVLIDGSTNVIPRLTNATAIAGLIVAGVAGTATLTIDMPYAGGVLTVTGNVDIGTNGVLTHTANAATAVQRLAMNVGGSLNVAAGGSINVDGQGFTYSQGPGSSSGSGASHAGQGGSRSASSPAGLTYGSVANPTTLGSGGANGTGGGAIVLTVAGATTLEGPLSARGAPVAPTAAFWGPGAGGSIALTTATLSGQGAIRANAAPVWYDDPAGGGRVSIVLTGPGADFTAFTGLVSAYGSANYPSVAGTVYRQTASQGAGSGTLIVDNGAIVPPAALRTQFPAATNAVLDELRYASVIVTNRGALAITVSDRIQSLTVASTNEPLNLGTNGTVLTLKALSVNGTPYNKGGTYTTNNWNGFSLPGANVTGAGAILINARGTTFRMR